MTPEDILRLTPVTRAQALGISGGVNLERTPIPDWQKYIDLPGVRNLLSQRLEIPDIVKRGLELMRQGRIPMGAAFNSLGMMPIPSTVIQKMLQQLNPQG